MIFLKDDRFLKRRGLRVMLRFQDNIDKVFDAILRASIDVTTDNIKSIIASSADSEAATEYFRDMYPEAGRVFAPHAALKVLQNMLECHNRPETYFLNDYHYLLIYDVVEAFCDSHNDAVSGSRGKLKRELSTVGEFCIDQVDFDSILDCYFFDTDFLTDQEVILGLSIGGRQYLGMNEEAFPIATGLSPHPEVLALKIYTGDDVTGIREESELFGPKSTKYPDWSYYEQINKS